MLRRECEWRYKDKNWSPGLAELIEGVGGGKALDESKVWARFNPYTEVERGAL